MPSKTQTNALVLLETILWELGRIYETGNALMLLETILCKFGRICVTGNALMLLETTLCKFGRIGAFVKPTVGRNSILNFSAKI